MAPTPVPFPAISLCNMRNLDFDVLNTLNRLFLADPHPQHHLNVTDNAFVREYMRTAARYGPLWYNYQEKLPLDVFQEMFSRTTFSANIPHDVISQAAVQIETRDATFDFEIFIDFMKLVRKKWQ